MKLLKILGRVERAYSELMIPTCQDYREYLELPGEVKTLIYGSIATALLAALAPLAFPTAGLPAIVAILAAGFLASSSKVLKRLSKYLEMKGCLGEEIPFAVLMAASSPRTGVELLDALSFIAERGGHVFPCTRPMAVRIVNLVRFLSLEEALTRLTGVPRDVRRIFSSYAASLSLGLGIQGLLSTGSEISRELPRKIARSIDLIFQAGLLLILALTTAPVLLLGLSSIMGPGIAVYASLLLGLSSPLIFLALPSPPLPLRLSRTDPRARLSEILGIVVFASLQALVVASATGLVEIARIHVAALSLVCTASGIPGLISFFRCGSRLEDAKRILSTASQQARAFGTVSEVRAEARGGCSPWIYDYAVFSLEFFEREGDLDPAVFESFAEGVLEIMSRYRDKVAVSALLLGASIAQAFFLSQILSMSISPQGPGFALSLASILSMSTVVSRLVLNTPWNTAPLGAGLGIFIAGLGGAG